MTPERAILDAAAANLRATAALIRAQGMASVNAYAAECGNTSYAMSNVPFTWGNFRGEAEELEKRAEVLEVYPA